jgi:hypothetical protein
VKALDLGKEIEYIPIDKSAVPYEFSIKLQDRTYRFVIKHNALYDFFTLDLSSAGGEPLCYGDPVRYGRPCFNDAEDERFPLPLIVPYCMSGGESVSTAGWNEFGDKVKLYLFERPSI